MGYLEMDTAALPPVLNEFDTAGDELGRAWNAGQDEIAWHEGGIGGGPLGLAFTGSYRRPTARGRPPTVCRTT